MPNFGNPFVISKIGLIQQIVSCQGEPVAERKVDFRSVHGSFKYNHNHFPTQDFYLQEAVKDSTGEFTMKNLGVVVRNSADSDTDKCGMKL